MDIPLALTFDDVLLVPQYSNIASWKDVSLKTKLTKNIELNIPLISSNMDTVTESSMCISMATAGGLGVLHRFCTIEEQVEMVRKVKRAGSYIITDPYTVKSDMTILDLKKIALEKRVNSFLVIDDQNVLIGIITKRDIRCCTDTMTVSDGMRKNLIVAKTGTNMQTAKKVMLHNKIQRLPILNENGTINGLICMKDIDRVENSPLATVDNQGRLRCGAGIGVKDYMERAQALIEADTDILCVDVAHGFNENCIRTIKEVKARWPHVPLIAGNVVSSDAAEALIKAGADAIKCGIGSGSICSTRIQTGHGKPQASALLDVAPICKRYGVVLISDGGNKNSGNMCKALGMGAHVIMLGRLLAGTNQSPMPIEIRNGKWVKKIRGMASLSANESNAIKQGLPMPDPETFHSEGVEAYTQATGEVATVLNQFTNGIRSGLSYSGARTISEFQSKAKFVRMTGNGFKESGIHSVIEF